MSLVLTYIYHENISLLNGASEKFVNRSVCNDLQTFTKSLVCDESNEPCMLSNCNYSANNFGLNIENEIIDGAVKIKWFQ